MQCVESEFRRRPVIVTRSGYTGEVGFELFTYQDVARELWAALSEAMEPFGGMPCGLAARDVLRLEMGYPLYGQDLFESVTALEAGLGWAVSFDKGEFRGATVAAERQKEEGCRAACAVCGCTSAGTSRAPTTRCSSMTAWWAR